MTSIVLYVMIFGCISFIVIGISTLRAAMVDEFYTFGDFATTVVSGTGVIAIILVMFGYFAFATNPIDKPIDENMKNRTIIMEKAKELKLRGLLKIEGEEVKIVSKNSLDIMEYADLLKDYNKNHKKIVSDDTIMKPTFIECLTFSKPDKEKYKKYVDYIESDKKWREELRNLE